MAMARFQSAGSSSTIVPVGSRMAAPLTKTRGAPCAAMEALTASAMLASLVTSQPCAIAAPPAVLMRPAVALVACSSISRQATLAPASAKAKAMARPMPSAAPTTMAGLPSRRKRLSGIEPAPIACMSRPPLASVDAVHEGRHLHLSRSWVRRAQGFVELEQADPSASLLQQTLLVGWLGSGLSLCAEMIFASGGCPSGLPRLIQLRSRLAAHCAMTERMLLKAQRNSRSAWAARESKEANTRGQKSAPAPGWAAHVPWPSNDRLSMLR